MTGDWETISKKATDDTIASLNQLFSPLENPNKAKPDIDIIHADAFEYPYGKLAAQTKHLKTLVNFHQHYTKFSPILLSLTLVNFNNCFIC